MKHNITQVVALGGIFHAQPSEGGSSTTEAPKEIKAALPASPIAGTVLKEKKYFFKKDELGQKRATVSIALPYPTEERVKQMFENDKEKAILMDAVYSLIEDNARVQVGDEKNPVNKQEELDMEKLTLDYIASIPQSERRGGGIGKDTWEQFFNDYVEVMVPITGKKKDNVENAGKLFVARLQPVKTQKKILSFLEQQLALWFTSSTQQEELGEVYEFLSDKIKTLMAADEAALLQNL